MFGYSETEEKLQSFVKKTSLKYFLDKEEENKKQKKSMSLLHKPLKLKQIFPIYDAYLKTMLSR